jgi:hypothetical protein
LIPLIDNKKELSEYEAFISNIDESEREMSYEFQSELDRQATYIQSIVDDIAEIIRKYDDSHRMIFQILRDQP